MNQAEKDNIIFYQFKKLINSSPNIYDEKQTEEIQEQLDSLVEDNSQLFNSLTPEEFLDYMITAYSNGFYLDIFYDIAWDILQSEKDFNVPQKEILNIISIMNEFSHEEKLFPIIKNFVKKTDLGNVIHLANANDREPLTMNFLKIFSEEYAWGIPLKQKSYLWTVCIYSFNSDFAKWLTEKEVEYDTYHNDTPFDMLNYYNVHDENSLELFSLIYNQEIKYREKNNLDISFKDTIEKIILEGNDTFFKFFIDKGYDISRPSFDYYLQLIENDFPENSVEVGQTKIKEYISLEEKKYLESQVEVASLTKKIKI